MKYLQCVLLLLSGTLSVVQAKQKQYDPCPNTWTRYNNNTGQCECGSELEGIVQITNYHNCNGSNTVKVLACYCMMYSEILNTTVVGNCLYSCGLKYLNAASQHTTDLTEHTCGRLHREGQLCGKCKPGYSPPVYSYSSCCVNCTDYRYNWLKYIAVAYVPLTIFYGGMVTFRVSASSPKMVSYILTSQVVATPAQLRYVYSLNENNRCIISPTNYTAIQIVASLYAIWNLDFFRSLYHPFCLHPNMTTVQVIALDYIIAVYPLALIVVTYLLVVLHDRFPTIAQIWRPLCKHFSRFRRQNDIRSSLIDAFATFILLSYMKILNVSFDLLTNTKFYDITGKVVDRNYLYYNGTQEMFHGEHTWYAVLAIFMLLLFNIFPLLLLCLYPFRCFQKCLNNCNMNSLTLLTFMDSFSGCYRTTPSDCRYFAGAYLLLRVTNLFLFSLIANRFYFVFEAILFLCATLLVAIVRPFKSSYVNKLNIFFLGIITFGYVTTAGYTIKMAHIYNTHFLVMMSLSLSVPLIYAFGLIIYYLLIKKTCTKLQGCILRERETIVSEPLPTLCEESATTHTYTENSLLLTSTHRVID